MRSADAMAAAIKQALADDERTQADLARMAGVSEKHVSRVLSRADRGTLAMFDYWAHCLGREFVTTIEPLPASPTPKETEQ